MAKLPTRITYEAPGNPSLAYQPWRSRCRVGDRKAQLNFVRLLRTDTSAYTHDALARVDVLRMLQEIGPAIPNGLIYVTEAEGDEVYTDLLISGVINQWVNDTTVFPFKMLDVERAVAHVLFAYKGYWISPVTGLGQTVMEQFLDVTEQLCRERKGRRDEATPGIIRSETREMQCYGRIVNTRGTIEVVVQECMIGSA
jgi:hypothetical protein